MAPSQDRESTTLIDRVALAFVSGLSALVLAGLIWGGIAITAAQLGFERTAPLWPVVIFASVMTLIGFVAQENFVGNFVGGLVRATLRLLGWLAP